MPYSVYIIIWLLLYSDCKAKPDLNVPTDILSEALIATHLGSNMVRY